MKNTQINEKLQLEATALDWLDRQDQDNLKPGDKKSSLFEVTAITAGLGNGWLFSSECLQKSLPLWEGVEIFIDHHNNPLRSVRDLAGIGFAASFDQTNGGIQLKVRPSGPSGRLLRAIGLEWLQSPEPRPRLGFSADIIFSASGNAVREILKVVSLDLVFQPARGGIFNRALNQINQKENKMNEKDQENIVASNQEILSETVLQSKQTLLALKLQQSNLPMPAQQFLQKEYFQRSDWKLEELEDSILRQRELAAAYQGRSAIQGAGKIESVKGEHDRLQAAADDLFGAPRSADMQGYSVARLSGIRELYVTLTGDGELLGSPKAKHVRLADSESLPNVLMNSFNKVILKQWDELGRAGYRWWEKVVQVEHFNSLQQVTGIILGETSPLNSIAEGTAYGELDIADSGESRSFVKYGGLLPITLEMIDKDETHKLRQMPAKLANSAIRNISDLVSGIFTSSNGTGPIMADGYHVFDSEGHANVGIEALSAASFEAASQKIYEQSMISPVTEKPSFGLDARYLLVPRSLKLTAMQILYPLLGRELNIVSENMQRGEMGDVIVVPSWKDAKDWAAIADPLLAPGIIIAERNGLLPEIIVADGEHTFDMVHNDVINLKVRHHLAIFAADYRPLYKANVP